MIEEPKDHALMVKADELLRGAIDLHMHTGPDIYPRSVSTYTAAQQAQEAEMRAIVVKSHSTDTAARAELVRELTGFPVYGGISLNYPVGGLNPYAVAESAEQGGKIVWLPTTSARHFLLHAENAPILREKSPLALEGLVASARGKLLPEIDPILELIAANDMILCSGHLEPTEAILVFERARELGVRRLVVTHPHAEFVGMTIEQMQYMASLGAFNEMHVAFISEAIRPPQKLEDIAEAIRAIGVEGCIMATDGGQRVNPTPLQMFRIYVARMLELGFTEEELRTMTATNPALVLEGTNAELDKRMALMQAGAAS